MTPQRISETRFFSQPYPLQDVQITGSMFLILSSGTLSLGAFYLTSPSVLSMEEREHSLCTFCDSCGGPTEDWVCRDHQLKGCPHHIMTLRCDSRTPAQSSQVCLIWASLVVKIHRTLGCELRHLPLETKITTRHRKSAGINHSQEYKGRFRKWRFWRMYPRSGLWVQDYLKS